MAPSEEEPLDDELLGGEYVDNEYAAIDLRLNGGVLSLSLFGLQLVTPYLVKLQPWRPTKIWLWPLVTPGALFILASLGLLCGLWARRRSKKSAAVRLGVLLNAVVFGILLLWGLVIFLIITSDRSTLFRPPPQLNRPGQVQSSLSVDGQVRFVDDVSNFF